MQQRLSLPQQIAQMIMVSVAPSMVPPTADRPPLRHWIQELGIGSVCLQAGHIAEALLKVQQLQTWAGIPLLVAAEVEWGLGQPFQGATSFPPAFCLSRADLANAEIWTSQMGQVMAREAQALGIHWLFAPVLEITRPPDNLISELRTWGSDPSRGVRLTHGFITGVQSQSVLTTAKYFPGYGQRRPTPPALHPWPTLSQEVPDWLQGMGLLFQQAIADGVDAIMTAHGLWPSQDSTFPATLSPLVLQKWLRQEWHYRGLIISDRLDQGILTEVYSPSELAVRAVDAGVDVLWDPPDPVAAIAAIAQAVEQRRLPPERIEQSVTRILRAKQKVLPGVEPLLIDCWPALSPDRPTDPGFQRGFTTAPLKELILSDPLPKSSSLAKLLPTLKSGVQAAEALETHIGLLDGLACAQSVAHAAIQQSSVGLPVTPQSGWLTWVWSGSQSLSANSPSLLAPLAHSIGVFVCNRLTPLPVMELSLEQASGLIVQWFWDEQGIPPLFAHLLQEQHPRLRALVAFGALPSPMLEWLTTLDPSIGWLHSIDASDHSQAVVMDRLLPTPTPLP